MTLNELIDRFIEDIRKLIEIRSGVTYEWTPAIVIPNDLKIIDLLLVDDTPPGSNKDLEIVSKIINNGLISHRAGEKLNIQMFLNDLTANQEKIVEQVRCIRDGNVVSIFGKPISEFDLLIEKLERIHQEIKFK